MYTAVYCIPLYTCILYTAVYLYTSASGAGQGVVAVYRYTARKSCMRGCIPPLLYTERQETYRRPNGYVGVCLSLTKLLLSVPDYL